MGHEGGFYLRSEYYYVHILLAISLNADSSEKLSFFLHPSTDTILSVVSSEIFGIIGVPSSQLSVCPVQEVEPLCPTAVQLCQ